MRNVRFGAKHLLLPSLLKVQNRILFFSNLKENKSKTILKSDCLYFKHAYGSFFISFTHYILKLLENNSTHIFEKGHCEVE